MKTSVLLKSIKDYVVLCIGCLIYCLGWTTFLIPAGIASGGGTGLCTILYFATGIPVAYSFFALNAILLIIGFLLLGKGFGVKTIVAIIVSSILFDVLPYLNFVITFDDRLITAIVGGLVEAIGIGLVLMSGGSTGGTDIVAMVINKYWPVSPGRVYLVTDLFIISLMLLIPEKGLVDMIYGFVVMIVFSFGVDYVLLGNKSSVQILVFSPKYKDIADHIIYNVHRGVTALQSVGWYSQAEGKVLLIISRKHQMNDVINEVMKIDKKAFISVSSANSVYGEGFEEIKTGIRLKKKDSPSEIA